ncbi:otoancorin-like isoform X1 [Pleurodeles waltl]
MVQRCLVMSPLWRLVGLLLALGISPHCSYAATINDTCTVTPVSVTSMCTNITSVTLQNLVQLFLSGESSCKFSFAEYACSENAVIASLNGQFVIRLESCYDNETVLHLDPQMSVLMFSRFDSSQFDLTLPSFKSEFHKHKSKWNEFILNGLWARELQRTDITNNSALGRLFQTTLQPFLTAINTTSLKCLLFNNVTCPGFREVVKGLDMKHNQMDHQRQSDICTSILSFLRLKKNATGSACLKGGSGSLWLNESFGHFSSCFQIQDLMALNKNLTVDDILVTLSVQQLVGFTIDSGALNDTTLMGSICDQLQSPMDMEEYRASLQAALMKRNRTLSPEVETLLNNRSTQLLSTQFPFYGPSNWTDLFRGPWNMAINNVSASHLSLIPKNITCESYQAIVKVVNADYANLTSEKRTTFYGAVIKPYLSRDGFKPRCLNVSRPSQNSTDWFVTSMGSFLTCSSVEDLALFANESDLQVLARDPANMQLFSSLNLSNDLDTYYTKLLTSAPGVNLSSIPGKYMCFLSPSSLKNVSAQEALLLAKRLSENCLSGQRNASTNATGPAPLPTPQVTQIAISLVNKLNNISVDTIKALGPVAVGLSPSQIDGISDKDLEACLPTLSRVQGWSPRQSTGIMSKLAKAGHQFNNLGEIGSLVSGVSISQLQDLPVDRLLEDMKNPLVTSQLPHAPLPVQDTIVQMIASVVSGPGDLIRNIDNSLVCRIPKVSLIFETEIPNVKDLNSKQWCRDQASMFFPEVIKSGASLQSLSPYVLQGFTCAASNNMDLNTCRQLAKAMKDTNAQLDEDQLSCLTKKVASNGTLNGFENYPPEMLLFLSSSNYSAFGNCKEYFRRAGTADFEILRPKSHQRRRLLSEALSCLNISSTNVSMENAQVLGRLVCDLNASYIEASAKNLLPKLKNCKSLTEDQGRAIQQAVVSGNTQFGSPSQWSTSTLQNLGPLVSLLSPDTLKQIPKATLLPWLTNTARSSGLSHDQVAKIIKSLAPSNHTGSSTAVCPKDKKITADNVQDPFLSTYYTSQEFDACLDNATMLNYLSDLTKMSFTDEQLAVVKGKLDKMYPAGYPKNLLPSLGAVTSRCNENDVKKWNISSVETLEGLLRTAPPHNVASAIIAKYTSSGNPLNSSYLNAIGNDYVCLLNDAQLNGIKPGAIRYAMALDTSACNASVKMLLYNKAAAAFEDLQNQNPAYYNLIKPSIGGAPAGVIKALALQNVNMDIHTFTKLNPDTVTNLTVEDVKHLLGPNVGDLKDEQNNPVVSNWITAQKQSDLDKLGIGLQGGTSGNVTSTWPTTITTTKSATNVTTNSTMSTIVTGGTASTTKSTNDQGSTNRGFSIVSPHPGSIYGCLQLLHILLISSLLTLLI